MNWLKTKLRYLKFAWRHLVIVLFFGLLPSIAFAGTYYTFDECGTGSFPSVCPSFYGVIGSTDSMSVSNSAYFSSPNSLSITGVLYIGTTGTLTTGQLASSFYLSNYSQNLLYFSNFDWYPTAKIIKYSDNHFYLDCGGWTKTGSAVDMGVWASSTWTRLNMWTEGDGIIKGNVNNGTIYESNCGSISISHFQLTPENPHYLYKYIDDLYISETYSLSNDVGLQIVNPTESYEYSGVQPMPFMFEYRNDSNIYDRVWVQIDQLHEPQYSLSPLSYNITTTNSTTTGMIYSSLAEGSYRVQGFLYNSVTDIISSSTGYVNFTVSSSTIPVGTIPSYTDQDFNELTKNPIWSTSSVNTVLEDMLNCSTGNWWDKLSCNVGKAIISIPEYMMKGYKKTVDGFLFVVKSVFPFNLPVAFLSAWNSSTDTLPSGLTFINDTVDSSGNVYLSLPSEWSSSSTVLIFGTIAFSNFTTANGFFAFIKALSPIIMWGIFIFSLWGLGNDVLRDIIGIKTGKTLD